MVYQANSGQQWDYVQLDTVSAPTLWDTRQASGVERHKKVHLSERQVLHLYTTKFLYIPDLETSQATLSYAFTSSHPPANPQITLCRQKCGASHLDVEILQVQSQISLPTLNFII